MQVVGIIPARYGSSRFPGKIIADIAGKSMIQRVYEQSQKSKLLNDLYVAVDDPKVMKVVQAFGGKAIMTATNHPSGTDRIAEVMSKIDGDIIVNIQGDQPLFDANMIDEAVAPMLENPDIQMSTLKVKIGPESYNDPAVVKVVTDENNFALYFSRSLIPYPRESQEIDVYEHVGLYVYRKAFLFKIAKKPATKLEKIEMLEQLRVLESGDKIYVVETTCSKESGMSVDIPADLDAVVKIINNME